jgi:hypothetical protein
MSKIMECAKGWTVLLLLLHCCGLAALGQTGSVPPSRTMFVGQAGVYTDYFVSNNYAAAYGIYQRPTLLNRYVVKTQLSKGQFDLPFNAMLTVPFLRADRIPGGPRSVWDDLLMPGNALSLQPSYRNKFKVLLGSHTANLSALTAGDIAYAMGAGLEFTPWIIRFKASYGITHREADTLPGFRGQYQRRMLTVQLGFGDEFKSHLSFQYALAQDIVPESGLFANRRRAEGQNGSIRFRVQPRKFLYLRGEVAVAAHSMDRDNTDLAPPELPAIPIIRENGSTVADAAIDTELGILTRKFNLTLNAKYVGANYRSLAYLYQVAGYLDITAAIHFKLFKSKLRLNGLGGVRRNAYPQNAFDKRKEISDQAIVNADGHLQLSKRLEVDAQYSNYIWQQPLFLRQDSIRQVTQSVGGSSALRLGDKSRHLLSANAAYEQYQDRYIVQTIGTTDLKAVIGGINFQVINKKQNGFTLGSNYFDYQADTLILPPNFIHTQWNAYTGIQLYLFKYKLQLMPQFQYSLLDQGTATERNMYALSLNVNAKLGRKALFTLQLHGRQQDAIGYAAPVQSLFVRNSIQFQF